MVERLNINHELGTNASWPNIFALFFCIFLTVKGLYFPSSSDSGTTGNIVGDFYWGTELYPRILGWDEGIHQLPLWIDVVGPTAHLRCVCSERRFQRPNLEGDHGELLPTVGILE